MSPSERINAILADGLVQLLVVSVLNLLVVPHPQRLVLVQLLKGDDFNLLRLRFRELFFDDGFFVVGRRGRTGETGRVSVRRVWR